MVDGLVLPGVLLVGGGVLLFALVGTTAFISPAIWNGPPAVALPLISEHALVWRVANVGFGLATIVTAAGLFLVPEIVGGGGAQAARVAAVVYALAAAPWLLTLAVRVAFTPGVADAFVAGGTIDPAFDTLDRLTGALFPLFILASSAAIVVLGAAILGGGVLGVPLGWVCVVSGLAIGGSYLVVGDTLPAFVYLPTTVVGIAVLLSGR